MNEVEFRIKVAREKDSLKSKVNKNLMKNLPVFKSKASRTKLAMLLYQLDNLVDVRPTLEFTDYSYVIENRYIALKERCTLRRQFKLALMP
jgi:hypothetical protein